MSAGERGGAPVLIRHFTDPSCPIAFSAERQRLRLLWLYGDQIDWELHMVVLSETAPEDFTPERISQSYRRLQLLYGMPIDWRVRVRVAPSVHACRAVVATRLRWPDREAAILRRLRVLNFAGELLDDSDTLELAAEQAGLPVAELAAWADAPEVEAAMRSDMAASRSPSPPAARRRQGLRPTDASRSVCPAVTGAAGAAVLPCLVRAGARDAAAGGLADRRARRPARLPAGRGLRGRDREPGAGAGPARRSGVGRGGARLGGDPARDRRGRRGLRSRRSRTSATELARAATFTPVGGDGYWARG